MITLAVVLAETVALAAGAVVTGSAVLVATAAQSLAGAAVEVFLLVGARTAGRPPDDEHPLGYGRESFFWSLIASLGVFVGGGVVALYYGVSSLAAPEEGSGFALGYLLLAIVIAVDLVTVVAAVRPLRRSAAARRLGFWRGLHRTSDAGSRTLVYDNISSVLGGVIGLAGLAVHQATGEARADGVASVLIGLVLFATTIGLLRTNRQLLTDRTISPDVVEAMRDRILAQHGVREVPEIMAVYTGPQAVLVTGTVVLDDDLDTAGVQDALDSAGAAIRERWIGETRVFLAPASHSSHRERAGTPRE